MASTTDITDADLMRLPRDGHKYELVDGEIRVSPAGARHGQVSVQLVILIGSYVRQRRLGYVFDSRTGFRWAGRKPGPKNLRSPDVSFVAAGRFPDEKVPTGFVEFAPDLAVEVLSPEDRRRDVLEKVGEYLDAGSRLVWVIDPETRSAAIHRSLTDVRHVDEGGSLEGEDVVPGLSCSLADVLG